jgi:peptide deformylase
MVINMALRNIVTKEDTVLRKKCRDVDKFDEKLGILLDDMAETMYNSNGVGLAGPQVGVLRRVVVIDVGDGLIELVNPVITKKSGKQRDIEGCLSCPRQWGYVVRPMNVTVKGKNRHGDDVEYSCEGYFARCVCHELDHLEGRLFIDIADEMVKPEDLEDSK